MIDFDALVLKPTVDIFNIVVTFYPTVSNPTSPPIITRGVYSSTPITVEMQDGAIFADQETTLGIRLAEFAFPPMEGDTVTITDPRHPANGLQYWIGNCNFDGQGGGSLQVRLKVPTT